MPGMDPITAASMSANSKPKSSKKGLIIAMVVGLAFIVILLAVVLIFAKPSTTTTNTNSTNSSNSDLNIDDSTTLPQ